ncbi:uncharacterized protein LOC143542496 [Bidens hawaiensis]|uniref:uncharacterized protein LOC143542496 n=1 Tax=Bidens hawaiensis TaxID=980011 RepID=UPI004049B500
METLTISVIWALNAPYYATLVRQAQVILAPYYTTQAYQVQTYEPQIPQGFAPQAYVPQVPQFMAHLTATKAQNSDDVVNGTLLINDQLASVLFDTSDDKSFISLDFVYIIDKPRDKLSKPFAIEVAKWNSFIIDRVIQNCVLTLNRVRFHIDLIPMQMGGFDVIVGMDWLTLNSLKLNLMSCFQAQRYLRKKCVAFLALMVVKYHNENKIQGIPAVRDFPNVFLDDVSGLPPIRQLKFRIDLVPGVNPVTKVPYRLAPSEMQELSNQLQ